MTTSSQPAGHTVAVWKSGRLVPAAPRERVALRRGHALGAALALSAATVLALYVQVLERDVDRHEIARAQLHGEQWLVQAHCDAGHALWGRMCEAQAAAAAADVAKVEDAPPPNEVNQQADGQPRPVVALGSR
jgi:hypothetical protein